LLQENQQNIVIDLKTDIFSQKDIKSKVQEINELNISPIATNANTKVNLKNQYKKMRATSYSPDKIQN